MQRILNLFLAQCPWQWQSLPPAPQWKDAYGSILISLHCSRALFEDSVWTSLAAGAALALWPFALRSVTEKRSGSGQQGLGDRLSLSGIIVCPPLFMWRVAFSSWGSLQGRLSGFICLLAFWNFVNVHLAPFSEYLHTHFKRKKPHFITRNKNIIERTQVAGN